MNNAPLSSEQMAAVLDDAPVAVYVCAVDESELLYANQLAMDALSFTDTETVTTCYAAGYDKPCPFPPHRQNEPRFSFGGIFSTREICVPISSAVSSSTGKANLPILNIF